MSNQNEKLIVVLQGKDESLGSTLKAGGKDVEKLESKFGDLGKVTSNLFGKIKGIGADTSIGKFTSEVTAGSSALSAMSGPAAIATGAIVGVSAVAYSAGSVLFGMAKNAAAAGGEISRFSTLTGFSVQTIGALKVAAEGAGTSIDEIEEVFESFVELMIEGGKNSEDAVEKIKSLGLDPQESFKDLEGSFLKVLDKIRSMPTQAGKAQVAMDGMGESGLNMIKVAEGMNGGTEKYIARLKEMGVVMDNDAIAKSKEFNKSLGLLELQVKGVTSTFAQEFMPEITGGMDIVQKKLSENKDTFRQWGRDVSEIMRGTGAVLQSEAVSTAGSIFNSFYSMARRVLPLLSTIDVIKMKGKLDQAREEAKWNNVSVVGADAKLGIDYELPRKAGPGGSWKPKPESKSGKTSAKDSPLKQATEDAKRLDEQLIKTIATEKNQLNAMVTNTKAREADNVALDLQLKGYDHLVSSKYKHIVALAREKDALTDTVEELRKLTEGYNSATQKYDSFVDAQLKGLREAKGESNVFSDTLTDLDKNVFDVISRAQNFSEPIVTGFDSITNAVKSTRSELKALGDTKWTSSALSDFVKQNGFVPRGGYDPTGKKHNPGSKHFSNEAVDVRVHGKTVDQIVDLMLQSLKAGARVVDERIRPKPGAKWKGAHLHLEENDAKASFFNPKLNYGGRLDELKAADAARLGKETSSKIGKDSGYSKEYFDKIGVSSQKAKAKISELTKTFSGFDVEAQKAFAKWLLGETEMAKTTARLSVELNELKGVEKSAADGLEEFAQNAKNAGVELDALSLANARHKAFQVDWLKANENLNNLADDQLQTQIEMRGASFGRLKIEEDITNEIREQLGLKPTDNYGIKAPRQSSITLEDDFQEKAPRMKGSASAYDIAGARGGDFKKGGIFDQESIDTQVSLVKSLGDVGMDVFNQMSDAIANAAVNWIAYGDAAGQGLQEVTAQILANVSAQALAQGLMELGIGFAALTPWGAAVYGPAPLHFKSAAILMGLGAGFGLGARAAGSGSSGSSSGKTGKNQQDFEQSTKPEKTSYVRDSSNQHFFSQDRIASQLEKRINELSENVGQLAKLSEIVETAKPGDVLVRGIRQSKGLIANTAVQELKANSTQVGNMNRILGNK